jgi:hypothetical protein
MVPAGAMNPDFPKTVIVSIACSPKKTRLSHASQRGMIGDLRRDGGPDCAG